MSLPFFIGVPTRGLDRTLTLVTLNASRVSNAERAGLNPPCIRSKMRAVKSKDASPTPAPAHSPRDLWGIAVVVVSLLLAGAAIWARRQIEFDPETVAKDAREAALAPATPTPSPTPAN